MADNRLLVKTSRRVVGGSGRESKDEKRMQSASLDEAIKTLHSKPRKTGVTQIYRFSCPASLNDGIRVWL